MKTKISSNLSRKLLLAVVLSPFIGVTAHAQTPIQDWNTGDGNWGDANNWTPSGSAGDGIPQAGERVYFRITPEISQTEVTIDVDAGQAFNNERILVFQGKVVNLNMGSGSSISSSAGLGIGTIVSTPLGSPGALFINGPESGTASLSFIDIQVGQSVNNVSGHLLQIDGAGLTVNSNSNVTVGRFANGNELVVSGGSTLNAGAMVVSGTTNISSGVGNDNIVLITGGDTSVHLGQSVSNGLGLVVASRPTTDLSGSVLQSGNTVTISDGARFFIEGNNANNARQLLIGGYQHYRHSNSVTVEGEGSILELAQGDGGAQIAIGHNSSANWNNSLEVRDGGLIRTNDITEVRGNTTVTPQRAQNRLVIGADGTFQTNSNIFINGGLLQLEEGGSLVAQDLQGNAVSFELNISSGTNVSGRFEVAGSGLDSSVETNINENGVLAVGLSGATGASAFEVSSVVNMFDDSTLELTIFGSNSIDNIVFLAGSQLNLAPGIFGDGVALSILVDDSYTLSVGDTFQIFSGLIGNINGEFADVFLPGLDGDLEWDLSAFNAAGGWQVSVVPEPGTYALLFGLGALTLAVVRRRKAQSAK